MSSPLPVIFAAQTCKHSVRGSGTAAVKLQLPIWMSWMVVPWCPMGVSVKCFTNIDPFHTLSNNISDYKYVARIRRIAKCNAQVPYHTTDEFIYIYRFRHIFDALQRALFHTPLPCQCGLTDLPRFGGSGERCKWMRFLSTLMNWWRCRCIKNKDHTCISCMHRKIIMSKCYTSFVTVLYTNTVYLFYSADSKTND